MNRTHEEVRQALLGGRARWACHMTYADALPDIAASGGLLAPSLRGAESVHSWGVNETAGTRLVCLSLAVSWAMVKHRMNGRELAILTVDLLRVPDLGRVRVSPYNSAGHDATPHLVDSADVVKSISLCNRLGERWKAEVLVPQGIPLSAVYGVVFCDATARDEWWPAFLAALPHGVHAPTVRLASDGRMFRLPDDYRIDQRSHANCPGVDRVVGPAPPGWSVRLPAFDDEPDLEEPHWMDLDDWDEPEEDEGPSSWADFYDDGEPDDPDWYEPSLRD